MMLHVTSKTFECDALVEWGKHIEILYLRLVILDEFRIYLSLGSEWSLDDRWGTHPLIQSTSQQGCYHLSYLPSSVVCDDLPTLPLWSVSEDVLVALQW